MTLTKSQRQQMRGLRTGICACQGRGHFVLGGRREECPACAQKRPRIAFAVPEDPDQRIATLKRKLASAREKSSRLASTNRKMKWALRNMVTVAETAGLDLNPGRKGWRIKARKR